MREHDLLEALLESGRLTEDAALDRCEVEIAVGKVLVDWARRSLGT